MKGIHFLYPIVGDFIFTWQRPVSLVFNAVGNYLFSYHCDESIFWNLLEKNIAL